MQPKQFNWMVNTTLQSDEECVGVVCKKEEGQAMGDLSQDDMNDDQMGVTRETQVKRPARQSSRQATRSRLAQAVNGHNTRNNSNNRRALDAE